MEINEINDEIISRIDMKRVEIKKLNRMNNSVQSLRKNNTFCILVVDDDIFNVYLIFIFRINYYLSKLFFKWN